MFDFVIIEGVKIYPNDNILDLNRRDISHFNEIENLENLSNLKELHLQHNNISSLEGLKNLKNLELLQLNDNKIMILSNLDSLENLEHLDLSNNSITSIESALKLKNLKTLDLYNNKLKSIAGLENCVNLEEIILNNNQIEKISGLSYQKKLRKLILSSNKITKIEGLENLENLEELYLGNNNIEILEGLNNLFNLRELDLRSNKINQITGLDKLKNLYRIKLRGNNLPTPIVEQFGENGRYFVKYCRGEYVLYVNRIIFTEDRHIGYENIKSVLVFPTIDQYLSLLPKIQKITDLRNLENLKNLEGLNLGGNKITEIEGLDSLESLKLLWLSDNKIKKIKNLTNLKKLEDLSLSFNEISMIEGLETLNNIKKLNLKGNKIKKIENLDKLTELSTFSLQDNEIEEIIGLESLVKLTELDLSKNEIKDSTGLKHLVNLRGLLLNENLLTGLGEISNLINLNNLNLEKNQLENIHGLDRLINLTELNLNNNGLENIEKIANLKKLRKLGLENNNIQDISSLKELTNLEYINLRGNPVLTDFGHYLKIPNNPNNPRRFIAYAILEPFLSELSGEIYWDDIVKSFNFLDDFHLNEIKEIIKLFPDIQLLVENGKMKSFCTIESLRDKLDQVIEPFQEQEDIPFSFISEKLYLPKAEDGKKISKIIIEKGISKFPLYETNQGIRKKLKEVQGELNMKLLFIGSNCKGKKEVLINREITKIRSVLENSFIEFFFQLDAKRHQVYEFISKYKPQIIHFSGHGTSETGPLFNGDEHLINSPPPPIETLIDDLRKVKEYAKIVIFNVCESINIAEKVSEFIDFTIGAKGNIDDDCAAAFSKGFYRILLNKDSLKNSFDNGKKKFSFKHSKKGLDNNKDPYGMFTKKENDFGEFIKVFGDIEDLIHPNQVNISSIIDAQTSSSEIQKKLISKLETIRDKIHSDYPFEEIKVRHMDSNFYNYIYRKDWILAKNQIVYKLQKEIELSKELMYKIVSLNSFKSLKNRFKQILDSKELKVEEYNIPPEKVAIDMMKGYEQKEGNLKRELAAQFKNIGVLTGNFTNLFSNDGIYIFLEVNEKSEAEKIKKYFISLNEYINKNILIDLDRNDITVDQVLQTSVKLMESIRMEQIEKTIKLLGNIIAGLEKVKGEFDALE